MKKETAVATLNHSQYVEHTLSDGYIIWKKIYFTTVLKMDLEFAAECYESQFQIDTFDAKTTAEHNQLKARKAELEQLGHHAS